MDEHRQRLTLQAQPLSPRGFEILAITAGPANGWEFPAEVLHQSLPLWEGVNCFVDHAWSARSVRDIAGVLHSPVWDEGRSGVRAELLPFGPSAEVLVEVGRQVLAEQAEPGAKVGFSADIQFKGRDGKVEKILRIFSVDLVYNPARGGIFLRAMNQLGVNPRNLPGGTAMQATTETLENPGSAPETAAPTDLNTPSAEGGNAVAELQAQLAEMRAGRAEMSAWLLETSLASSNLPASVRARIQKQFAGRTFAPAELQSALREARTLLSELEGARLVNGPARVEGMVDPADRLQAAVDDLFAVPRQSELKNVSVPRLSGIRELYLTLTGDTDLHGGYYPERVQLATTADFSGLVRNALNKIVTNTWEELGRAGYDWWKSITVQEHFNSLHDITGTLVGTVGDLPQINEGALYPELNVGDSPEMGRFAKYGGYIPLTLELIDRDETRKLRSYARELASAGMRKISRLVADIFTADGGIGPEMSDGSALFNNTPVNTTGHANLDTLAFTAANWETVCQRVYSQPMLVKNALGFYGTGPHLAVNPKFMLVPRALQKTALEVCQGSYVREAGYVYDNVLKGSAAPVVVPDWSDEKSWAAVCDPRVAPAVFIGERFGLMPEIFVAGDENSPAVFSNDEHRLKVRHYLAVWVNDFRPLYKCNVA